MHLEVLVEERSAEEALKNLIPKIMGQAVSFRIHPHQGKPDMLGKLSQKLRAYRKWITEEYRIVVVIDLDQGDCTKLKNTLEQKALEAGLGTKTSPEPSEQFQVVNRIVIEELEAWFFGDWDAVTQAFPRVSPRLVRRENYRDPDAIRGGTWEALDGALKRAHYFSAGMPKIEVARRISQHMYPERNRSRSFQVFREGLLSLIPGM